jgi:hypothetical protein
MRNWGFQPSREELTDFTAPLQTFREKWSSIQPPFPASFDGQIADVLALDYMEYEGIAFPQAKVKASAMVCGEVLRRAAGLEWVISYRDDWFVASPEECVPALAICPLARLHELECGRAPQSGAHLWVVQRAAFECLMHCGPEREPMIRELLQGDVLQGDGDYLECVEKTLEALRGHDRSEGRSKRARRRSDKKKPHE